MEHHFLLFIGDQVASAAGVDLILSFGYDFSQTNRYALARVFVLPSLCALHERELMAWVLFSCTRSSVKCCAASYQANALHVTCQLQRESAAVRLLKVKFASTLEDGRILKQSMVMSNYHKENERKMLLLSSASACLRSGLCGRVWIHSMSLQQSRRAVTSASPAGSARCGCQCQGLVLDVVACSASLQQSEITM